MTDPGATPPAAPGRGRWSGLFGHLKRFRLGWRIFITLGEVVASIAAIGTVIGVVNHVFGGDAKGAANSSSQTSAPQPSASGTSTHASSQATPSSRGPRCWTTAKVLVDCRETHRYEEIPQAPTCTAAVVTGFLGGRADLDVLVARPVVLPGTTCTLDAGHELRDSAKDVLQGGTGAVWRRCTDRSKGKNVPCSVVHTGEYVATGKSSRATDPDCLVAAAAYLDQLPGNLIEDLAVRPIEVKSGNPDPARCIIDARGNHRLTDSVRNLGSQPVPILSN